MMLPQTAEYALRAMSELAMMPASGSMRAKDLARITNVPPHYMAKVLRRLVAAGLLVVRRGRGGGFRLARVPSRIRFADIIAAVDAAPSDGCAFGYDRCDDRHPCLLHPTFSALKDSVHAWSVETTLAHVRAWANEGSTTRRA